MILNVLSHSFPWNPKSGSVPLSKTKMASAPRFPGEIDLDLADFPRQHCHYGSYPGRKRSTANRQRNRSIDRHHGGMVKVYLKIPEELGGLSSFVMFPYVSICFHLFSICYKKTPAVFGAYPWSFWNVLNRVGLFFVPTGVADGYLSAWYCMHVICDMYINMCIAVYTYYVIWYI